ncbi:hypothetical protein EYZ11_004323 [Aspergillus tanneri]|uniref:O-methyltransferase C-terminal domain-containing protein n=1 Tax=Aspergillus tanneri TaxID=1220188 RepID=A0A4V3UPR6_9EURO|nr:hypothetical protein EYZ11_004323 [Aspergillus tanneri]
MPVEGFLQGKTPTSPQQKKGALTYYIRRDLNDWPDHLCVDILKNIANAMEPGRSRLVIAEIVVPPTGGDSKTGWMDLVLMTVTGVERRANVVHYLPPDTACLSEVRAADSQWMLEHIAKHGRLPPVSSSLSHHLYRTKNLSP